MREVPTYLGAEPAIGFRIFRVNLEDNTLQSFTGLGKHSPWMPGQIMSSVCSHVPQHGEQPPHLNCTCGFWAVKSRRDLGRAYPCLAQRCAYQWQKEREWREKEARKHKIRKERAEEMGMELSDDAIKQLLNSMTKIRGGVQQAQSSFRAVGGQGTRKRPLTFVYAPHTTGRYGGELNHLVSARVQLWGTVHEHERGFRAQYAQIIPGSIRWWPRQGAWFRPKLLQHIIDKYTVEGGDIHSALDLPEE